MTRRSLHLKVHFLGCCDTWTGYLLDLILVLLSAQKESLSDVQLHVAAREGDLQLLRRILDSGKVHVDCKDKARKVLIVLSGFNVRRTKQFAILV